MTRTKGIIPFSGNFEVQAAAPLDARLRVETRADLLLANSWEALDGSPYAYEGMPVAVWNDTTAENNGIYILQDTDFTDINNWLQVSGSGGSGGTASWDGVYQTPTGTQVQVDGSLQDWVNIHFPSMVQTITISAIPSFGLREFGDDVTNPQIIGNSGLGSNPAGSLTLMEWWRGAEGGTELNPDEANPTSSTNYTRTDTFTVSTNQSYTVKSTDDQTRTDTASGGYSFVFPFYWGVGDENTDIFDGITQAQILAITGMGKYVQTSGTKAVTVLCIQLDMVL